MPEIVYTVIRVVQLFLAVGLVAIIVLLQRSEGGLGGLGGGGGGAGGMGGFLAGRTQANVITRTTAFLAGGFLLATLILAYGDHQRPSATTLVPAATTGAPTTNTQPEAPKIDSGSTSTPVAPAAPAQPAAPSGQ